MTAPRRIGLVVHAGRDASLEVAAEAAGGLQSRDIEVVALFDEVDERPDLPLEVVSTADGLDLAISLGGDGTFLRAAHLCRDAGVPVLGVNLGRLGFLAEIELPGLPHALDVVANGAFEVEERATLDATMHDPDGASLGTAWALNEVAIEKSARHRLLHMEVLVGASPYARVPADALLVATVTGSSAYALSAGGPLLSPHVEATLVTPVAPHSLFDRTLVCGPREVVRVEIAPDQPEALVSCDGREPTVVPAGGWVEVVGSDTNVRLARLGELDFYTLVRDKFGLR